MFQGRRKKTFDIALLKAIYHLPKPIKNNAGEFERVRGKDFSFSPISFD